MKLTSISILAATLLALSFSLAEAGDGVWTPAGPPGTAMPEEMVLTSVSHLLLTDVGPDASGVWRSGDGGRHWRPSVGVSRSPYVLSLAADPHWPGVTYALANLPTQTSIRVTRDDGRTWSEAYLSPPGTGFSRLFADAARPNSVWAIANNVVVRSDDGGVHWAPTGTLGSGYPAEVDVDPSDASVVYVAHTDAFFKSVDRGAHWTPISTFQGTGFAWLRIAPSRTSTIYAHDIRSGSPPSHCLRSDDAGLTWTPLPFPDPRDTCDDLRVDPADARHVWVLSAGSRRLYASNDGGATWPEVHELLPRNLMSRLLRDTDGTFYIGGVEGVYRSENGGQTWTVGCDGLTQTQVFDLAVLPGRQSILLAAQGREGLVRSRNGGRTWQDLPLVAVGILASDPGDPRRVLALGAAGRIAGVFESRDAGTSWTRLGPYPPSPTLLLIPPGSRTLYLGTLDSGVYRSQNGGRTWRTANSGLPLGPPCDQTFCPHYPVTALRVDPASPRRLFTVFRGRLFQSVDAGSSWTEIEQNFGDERLVTLDADPRRPGTWYLAGMTRLFRSTDSGASWEEIGQELVPDNSNEGSVYQDLTVEPRTGTIYVATSVRGVLRSRDGGDTWDSVAEGLSLLDVRKLALDPGQPDRLFAIVAGAGVWSRRF
jgi:photosystem II stability/assembly factor-like uncharacterized protein